MRRFRPNAGDFAFQRIANIADCSLEGVEFELSGDFVNGQ